MYDEIQVYSGTTKTGGGGRNFENTGKSSRKWILPETFKFIKIYGSEMYNSLNKV